MARPTKYATEAERREARRAQWREYASKNPAAVNKDRHKSKGDRHAGRRRVAVLDFETEPFDNKSRVRIEPFCAVLYYGERDYHVFWNSNPTSLIDEIVEKLKGLPPSLVYAHNGGPDHALLDGRTLDGTVGLAPLTNPPSGTRWGAPLSPVRTVRIASAQITVR